jgi:hypothetical protein
VNGWNKFKAYLTLWRPSGRDWWKAKPLGPMRTRLLFSDLQLICFSAQALANLIAASKIEDSLGVVQSKKSIPKALNAFIGCLNNMEEVRTPCLFFVDSKKDSKLLTLQYIKTDLAKPPADLEGHQLLTAQPHALSIGKLSSLPRNLLLQHKSLIFFFFCQVLTTAIYQIVVAFFERMDEFSFPPECSQRLQEFVRFKA